MTAFEGVDFYGLEELFTPAEHRLRDTVRAWVQERFLPRIPHDYREGTFSLELVPELAQLGAFGASIEGYDCAGLGAVAVGLLMQELERGDSGLRTFASVQGSLAMQAIFLFGTEQQKQRWLPPMAKGEKLGCFALTEPECGSDPASLVTRAYKTKDGYVLNGEKMWIGNGTLADVAVIWAKLDDDSSADVIRGFLVERGAPGFKSTLIDGKLSLRAAFTAKLEFHNCELPADALLPSARGIKSPFLCLNQARYGIAWGAIGAAMACYDEARRYALQRTQFGRPIAGFQLVQQKLVRMVTEITKAQLLAYRLAQLKDAGSLQHYQISMAKMNNVDAALTIAREARDLLGGVGILDSRQCFRHLCNLESVKTYEGTHDIHTLILGQHLTGIAAFAG